MNRLACSRYSKVFPARKQKGNPKQHHKGTAQAVKDGCAQQKSLDAFGLLLQDFFNQIVQHEMVTAGERLDKAGSVLMSLHRKRG